MEVKSIKGLIFKFGISYIILLLGLTVIFNILDISRNTSTMLLVIFFLLRFWITKYLDHSGVELSKSDFLKIFFGTYLLIAIYDFIITTIAIITMNLSLSKSDLMISIALGTALNALAIFFTIYISNKQFKKKLLLNKEQDA